MSPPLDAAALEQVTRTVLETAVFLFCDRPTGVPEPHQGDVIEAVIRFDAPVSGRIALRLPHHLGLEAAANLLGVEPDDPDAQDGARAAVAELLNMVSGAALKEWFGASATWALGVPATTEVAGRLPSGRLGAIVLLVDEAPLEIEVMPLEGAP